MSRLLFLFTRKLINRYGFVRLARVKRNVGEALVIDAIGHLLRFKAKGILRCLRIAALEVVFLVI